MVDQSTKSWGEKKNITVGHAGIESVSSNSRIMNQSRATTERTYYLFFKDQKFA